MQQINLTLKKLTREAFVPYGDVLEISEANQIIPINFGKTERHHDLARLEVTAEGGKPIISMFRSQGVQLPMQVKEMERHPLGSQAFMPLSGNSYVVVVGPPGEFDVNKLQAFIAASNQGVNYLKGTWHHYSVSLNEGSDFLVVDRGASESDNCDDVEIPADISIMVDQ